MNIEQVIRESERDRERVREDSINWKEYPRSASLHSSLCGHPQAKKYKSSATAGPVLVQTRGRAHKNIIASRMSWGYEKENGPETWAKNFQAARGPRQSPIDIQPEWASYDPSLTQHPLTIKYSTEPSLLLENPGLSLKAHITADSYITQGPLGSDKYKLVQFHFHWGNDDKCGSEHTVNGKTFPSELHLVHYNSDKYKSFADAVTQPDGLAVIGVFITVGSKDHEGFRHVAENSSKIKQKGAKYDTGVPFNPASLLPENTSRYWTYEGSLTTPPCNESVTWIVLQKEISISAQQMRALRNLCCDECGSKPIPANFRPPLPLGARGIKSSFVQ